jgi:hypothetical protein
MIKVQQASHLTTTRQLKRELGALAKTRISLFTVSAMFCGSYK